LLQLYQELLDTTKDDHSIPEIGITRDDMQVFVTNTNKLGLFEATSILYIGKFYTRVRRVAAGVPTRDLIGVGSKSFKTKRDALAKEMSDCITAGHAVVNFLERQVPPERIDKRSGASIDLWQFRKRADDRREKERAKIK
jgi:hypothetical protein